MGLCLPPGLGLLYVYKNKKIPIQRTLEDLENMLKFAATKVKVRYILNLFHCKIVKTWNKTTTLICVPVELGASPIVPKKLIKKLNSFSSG